jgi:hypothetical protein
MADFTLRDANEVPGRYYRTPKELWGFQLPAVRGNPKVIARKVLTANALRLGLNGVLGTIRPRRIIQSLGAWHVIFSQHYLGRYIHRAYVTVHMDGAGHRVYLIRIVQCRAIFCRNRMR